jgi:hypothetical protein
VSGLTATNGGTRIDFNSPASVSGVGAKDVVVTASASGAVTAPGAYTYNPRPAITSVTPDNGQLDGGNRIIIVGTDFIVSPGFAGAIGVTIDGNACTNVTVNTTTQITCDTPATFCTPPPWMTLPAGA